MITPERRGLTPTSAFPSHATHILAGLSLLGCSLCPWGLTPSVSHVTSCFIPWAGRNTRECSCCQSPSSRCFRGCRCRHTHVRCRRAGTSGHRPTVLISTLDVRADRERREVSLLDLDVPTSMQPLSHRPDIFATFGLRSSSAPEADCFKA